MEFRSQTATVDGVDYTVTEMEAGTALAIQEKFSALGSASQNALQWGEEVLAASLRKTVAELRALPFTHYLKVRDQLSQIALEVNGLKVTKADDAPGEPQAGASPADSISTNSSLK